MDRSTVNSMPSDF